MISGFPSRAQPDDPAGGLEPLVVLADHTDARLGLKHIAVGVDLAVAEDDPLHGSEPEIGDRPLDVQGRVGHPGAVGWGLLSPAPDDQYETEEQERGHLPAARSAAKAAIRKRSHWSSTPGPLAIGGSPAAIRQGRS